MQGDILVLRVRCRGQQRAEQQKYAQSMEHIRVDFHNKWPRAKEGNLNAKIAWFQGLLTRVRGAV
jgi:hypothetical protein